MTEITRRRPFPFVEVFNGAGAGANANYEKSAVFNGGIQCHTGTQTDDRKFTENFLRSEVDRLNAKV